MKTEDDLKCPKCDIEHSTQNPALAAGAHWDTCNIWYERKAEKVTAVCLKCGHEWKE